MKVRISFIIFSFLIFLAPSVYAIDAVASFGKMDGNVQVLREARKIPGRLGLILNDQDVVVTGRSSKVTIIFRDGSEIRLFQDSRFVIEKSQEEASGERRFMYNFKLKLGSFWGRFTKGRQKTQIETPSATIGIKGTNLAMAYAKGKVNVSLSEGLVSVENEDHSYNLQAGNRLQGVKRKGGIKDKMSAMPYRVTLKADKSKIEIPEKGETEEIFFTVQLIEVKTRKNLHRKGDVYITLDNDKFDFPERVQLNKRGYARVRAVVRPFQKADYKNGQLEIFAVMDGKQAMEVAAGETLLTYNIPKKIMRTIRVDMSSGRITE